MEFFQILTGLSEGQNAESIAELQRQLNRHAVLINEIISSEYQDSLMMLVFVVAAFAMIIYLFLAVYSLTKRVKRLELALREKRAD